MDIDQFLVPIREFNLDQTKCDTVKILFDFQRQINTNIFYQIPPETNRDEIFQTIWKFLLKSSNDPSSTTRIAACKAIGTFLTWITPFFAESIRNSFIDVVITMTDNTKNSAVISSSYSFLSTFIAEPLLPDFLKYTQLFNQFILNDASSSEHLSVIISKFSHFDPEWQKNLLNQFLHQIEEKQDRNLIKAISSIVKNDPIFYIQIVLDFTKPKIQKFLSLLTFLVTTFQEEIASSTIDLMPLACSSIDIIADDKSNIADLDSALQILAIKNDSFNFSASSINSMTCDMKIWNKKGEEKMASIELKKVISMPSFYSLSLPLSLLKPNQEADSVLVLKSKLKSISSNENFDMNEVFSILEPFLKSSYNESTSSAIQAFSICVNSIISIVPLKKLYSIMRKVLFTKPLNWYHSFDILQVITSIDSNIFREKIGEKCFIEILNTLIDFCFCENESLSSDAMKSLSEKAYVYDFDKVIDLVIKKCDFFELLKLDRCVSTLTVILTKFALFDRKSESLSFFSQKLIEAVPMYYESVNFLCHVFNFFSIFETNHKKQKSVIVAAYYVLFSTIEIISGRTIKSTNKIEDHPFFKELLRNDLSSRSVDIITDSSDDQKAFIFPMKCALSFLFKNAPIEGSMIAAMNSYRLLPLECSEFFEKCWENGPSFAERIEIFMNLLSILKNSSDERIHSTWCRICLKMNQESATAKSEDFKEVVSFLIKMASIFLSKSESNSIDSSVPSSYIEFLYNKKKNEDSVSLIKSYLDKINNKEKLTEIVKLFPQILEIVPSIKSRDISLNKEENENEKVDSKSEKDDQNELKNIPEKVDDNQLFQYFDEAVRQSNIKLLKEVIQLMSERKMTINLEETESEFPPETIPIVSIFLANCLTSEYKEEDLLKALRSARTLWRQYSIEVLKKSLNANKLIEILMGSEKVKKIDILNLCSLIGNVDFDNGLLFKLSSKLLFESKKFNRFRVTLKLLTTVISIQSTQIPPPFLSSLATNLTPNIKNVDTEGMSIALLLIAQKVGFRQELVKFSDDVILYSGYRSYAHGRIIQIYIGISSSFPTVAQKINDVFSDLTVSYLKSVLPSRFNLGCRLFEQTVFSMKQPTIGLFLAKGIDIIVNRYNGVSKYPSAVISATKSIMSFISRDGINQQHLVLLRNLNKINLTLNDACFITFISIMNVVIRRFATDSDFMKKFPDSFFDSVFSKSGFNNGNAFKYARLCLLERLNAIKSEISREKLIEKSSNVWISSLPNFLTASQLIQWWNIIESHFSVEKSFAVFERICVSVIKICGFEIAFPSILYVFIKCNEKCNKLNEFKNFLKNVYQLIDKKCQKEAFDEMKKLPEKKSDIGIEKCKKLIELTFSEEQ